MNYADGDRKNYNAFKVCIHTTLRRKRESQVPKSNVAIFLLHSILCMFEADEEGNQSASNWSMKAAS